MKTFKIEYSENGGEYIGVMFVTCREFQLVGRDVLLVDGVKIVLQDEEVVRCTEVDDA